jgi:hypothetical protein
MSKTVWCVGGPADGKELLVSESARTLTIPHYSPDKLTAGDEWNLMANIIGWDDYGPIFERKDIKKAEYDIYGNTALYREVDA